VPCRPLGRDDPPARCPAPRPQTPALKPHATSCTFRRAYRQPMRTRGGSTIATTQKRVEQPYCERAQSLSRKSPEQSAARIIGSLGGESLRGGDMTYYLPLKRAGECRQHTHACVESAVRATDVETCAAFLELAYRWTWLAKRSERLEADRRKELQSVVVVVIKPPRRNNQRGQYDTRTRRAVIPSVA
jgi:hypothetical protein